MGVDTRFITLYGVELPNDDEFFDEYHEKYDYMEGPVIFGEGKMWIGHIILKTESMRWDAPDGHEVVDIEDLPKYKSKVFKRFAEDFPDRFSNYLYREWRLHTFVHYT